jgi:hypothetical protein
LRENILAKTTRRKAMKTVRTGFWEMQYSEAEDAIRILVNGFSREAVLFRLTKDNVSGFLSALDADTPVPVILQGQPMVPQEQFLTEEGGMTEDGDYEEDLYSTNYEVDNADLSGFYDGEASSYELLFEDSMDRRLLSSSLWEFWALDHILAETK